MGQKKLLCVHLSYMCEPGIYKEKNHISCGFSLSNQVKGFFV